MHPLSAAPLASPLSVGIAPLPVGQRAVPNGGRHSPHAALLAGLSALQARIPQSAVQDLQGLRLLEAVGRTDAYYLHRVEESILARALPHIAREAGQATGGVRSVIQPGAGNCRQAVALCQALAPSHYLGIDRERVTLADSARALQHAVPGTQVLTQTADIEQELTVPWSVPQEGRLVVLPGSGIGQLAPEGAAALLQRLRRVMGPRGALLLGVDLVKAPDELVAAYDDRGGVHAAYNRHALEVVNRLVGADFDPAAWQHRVRWDAAHQRIELRLRTPATAWVSWDGGERRFQAGETVLTQLHHKYTVPTLAALLRRAGLKPHRAWTDERGGYALAMALPA